jgi:sigma-E factor negative regulatory protein RseA
MTIEGVRLKWITGESMIQKQETLESLSAYMDGELPVEYRDGFLADVKSDDKLRAQWSVYHCIGDVLRSDDMACHSSSFVRSFSARIDAEPYLFAPEVAKSFAAQQAAGRRSWRMPASIAAGVVAVVVTGAVVMLPQRSGEVTQSAAVKTPATVIAAAPVTAGGAAGSEAASRPLSSEYLIAHRYYSNGLAMQGVVSHVRTAGYDGK